MTFTSSRKKYNKDMKHLKTFKQLNEATANGPAEVQAGDSIRLVNNTHMEGDTVSQTVVKEVLPDGRILTNDFGHGVIAKYDDGYDAWVVDEDDERGDDWDNPGVEAN